MEKELASVTSQYISICDVTTHIQSGDTVIVNLTKTSEWEIIGIRESWRHYTVTSRCFTHPAEIFPPLSYDVRLQRYLKHEHTNTLRKVSLQCVGGVYFVFWYLSFLSYRLEFIFPDEIIPCPVPCTKRCKLTTIFVCFKRVQLPTLQYFSSVP